jgi:hypothetical protein
MGAEWPSRPQRPEQPERVGRIPIIEEVGIAGEAGVPVEDYGLAADNQVLDRVLGEQR